MKIVLFLPVYLLTLAWAQPLSALTRTWNNSTGGSFTTAANWSLPVVPGSTDQALFRRGAGVTYTTTFPGKINLPLPVYAMDQVRIGNNTVTFADSLGIGQVPGSVTITNPTTALAGRALVVGETDIDTAAVLNSSLANFSAVAALLGDAPESSGTLNVTGGVLSITGSSAVDDELIIGKQGYGELNISGGARVNVTGAEGSVLTSQFADNFEHFGVTSLITIRGAGSQLNVNGTMTIGLEEKSVVLLESGGLLTTGSATVVTVEKFTFTEHRFGSYVVVEGTGSRWENAGDLSLGAFGDQRPGEDGLVLLDGGTVAVGGVLTNFGVINGANGTIEGDVINHHRIRVGVQNILPISFGLLHITGNYEQDNLSLNLEEDFLSIEGITAASPGKLRVDGNVTLDSLTSALSVSGTGDPLLDQYDSGDAFDIFDFNGAVTGSFKTITLPPLSSSLRWNTSELYTTGVIRVVLAGDFDFDGDVDGRDFLAWQRGESPTPFSAGDLAAWQMNYGTGPLMAASVVVPEPATWLFVLCQLLCCNRSAWPRGDQ